MAKNRLCDERTIIVWLRTIKAANLLFRFPQRADLKK
jgi:hypothetical protein